MKALILVGGFGTRLRPLTLSMPKPLVPFVDKPTIIHQIQALKSVGVTEVILAVCYQPDELRKLMEEWEAALEIKISYSVETTPLGTAGPLALAKSKLEESDDPFFVLNSDITCTYPLDDLLTYHRQHGKEGTIMVTQVQDPSKYGVVVSDSEGKIQHFVEKPQTFVSNRINAGIYIFNPAILSRIQPKPTSIEKEIFPAMAGQGQLYAKDLVGHWMDIGQPKDYLTGISLYLANAHPPETQAEPSSTYTTHGNVFIHKDARIGPGSEIGPNVSIGKDCQVGAGVRLVNCALFEGAIVKDYSNVNNCILAWGCKIGRWCRIGGGSVLGKDVTVKDELYINGAKILPFLNIGRNVLEPENIIC
eukprot:TRINITY_DN104585_c0_g1_i1.p1 TRINITY_DN104585_c0_g1~~TRINITY_DN104585_c0_g1_i1.p1  ORF type:complete len:362 (-),score=32.69 TRINITY_DN104585_c0_g1_i1:497-1582(-)